MLVKCCKRTNKTPPFSYYDAKKSFTALHLNVLRYIINPIPIYTQYCDGAVRSHHHKYDHFTTSPITHVSCVCAIPDF